MLHNETNDTRLMSDTNEPSRGRQAQGISSFIDSVTDVTENDEWLVVVVMNYGN